MADSWPGNVRELENVMEQAMILSDGSELRLGDWFAGPSATPMQAGICTLEDLERAHICKVLKLTGGRVGGPKGAAAILGLHRSTLQSRMLKLGIEREQR